MNIISDTMSDQLRLLKYKINSTRSTRYIERFFLYCRSQFLDILIIETRKKIMQSLRLCGDLSNI